VNPHTVLARLIARLLELAMAHDASLGPSTVAPTLYRCDQTSANVIPGRCTLHLDWRYVPGESPDDIVARVQSLLDECLIPGSRGEVRVATQSRQTYTGHVEEMPLLSPPFLRAADDPLVTGARDVLAEALGRPVGVKTWGFTTDGGHLAAAGVPCIGFGPGDESLAHTVQEHITMDELVAGMVGYMALVRRLGEA
jgi:acetylornithine deacetylase/succinyl-diaminopimelate desuccinylase-like protein